MEVNPKTLIKEVNELIDQIQNDPDFQPVISSEFNVKIIEKSKRDQFFEILKLKIIKIALRLDPKFVVMADALLKVVQEDFFDLIFSQNLLNDQHILREIQPILKSIFSIVFLSERVTKYLKDMKVEVVTEKK